MTLEIVAQSVEDALAAEGAGADRLELVSALALGGLTPSIGLMLRTIAQCKLPVVAMLRPRSGGFAYSADEQETMLADGRSLLDAGAKGLVFGVLDGDAIDVKANARLVALGGTSVFHRALDLLPDPLEALETIIDLGFRRVLTSGGPGTAPENADAIRRLVERADGRIEVLPGGGVRPENAADLVARTGVTQLHLAALEWRKDATGGRIAFNAHHPEDAYGRVDGGIVAETRRATKGLQIA